jgi:hypothetical protein
MEKVKMHIDGLQGVRVSEKPEITFKCAKRTRGPSGTYVVLKITELKREKKLNSASPFILASINFSFAFVQRNSHTLSTN